VDAKQKRNGAHHKQREHALFNGLGLQEHTAKVNHRQQTGQIDPVARRQ